MLGYRQRFLRASKRAETNDRFNQFAAEVAVDWDAIKAKTAQEKERERERPNATSGGGGGGGGAGGGAGAGARADLK